MSIATANDVYDDDDDILRTVEAIIWFWATQKTETDFNQTDSS